MILCPSTDVSDCTFQSSNQAKHEDLSLLECYAVLMGKQLHLLNDHTALKFRVKQPNKSQELNTQSIA